jgi:hypothetical protein
MTRSRTSKKASTLVTDRSRIKRHIKPLLGSCKVAAVTSTDVEHFMHDVAAGKTAGKAKTARKGSLAHDRDGNKTAGRTVGLLGAMFTYAIRHGMRSDNPVRGGLAELASRSETGNGNVIDYFVGLEWHGYRVIRCVSYFVFYRTLGARQRWFTIGRQGEAGDFRPSRHDRALARNHPLRDRALHLHDGPVHLTSSPSRGRGFP